MASEFSVDQSEYSFRNIFHILVLLVGAYIFCRILCIPQESSGLQPPTSNGSRAGKSVEDAVITSEDNCEKCWIVLGKSGFFEFDSIDEGCQLREQMKKKLPNALIKIKKSDNRILVIFPTKFNSRKFVRERANYLETKGLNDKDDFIITSIPTNHNDETNNCGKDRTAPKRDFKY